jgi:hypothetical protein
MRVIPLFQKTVPFMKWDTPLEVNSFDFFPVSLGFEVESLAEAWEKTQNLTEKGWWEEVNPEYISAEYQTLKEKSRSSVVGDCFMVDGDVNQVWRINHSGFSLVKFNY